MSLGASSVCVTSRVPGEKNLTLLDFWFICALFLFTFCLLKDKPKVVFACPSLHLLLRPSVSNTVVSLLGEGTPGCCVMDEGCVDVV